MGTSLEVVGARELRRTLKAAGVSIQDLKDVNAQVAHTVHAAAQPHAPRRSGRLAGTERPAGTQAAAIVRAGGARTPYAGPIHWGWPNRHITANPWLYDAATNTQAAWLSMYLRAIDAVVATIEGAEG